MCISILYHYVKELVHRDKQLVTPILQSGAFTAIKTKSEDVTQLKERQSNLKRWKTCVLQTSD